MHVNEALLFWYDENKRELPWRATSQKKVSTYETWLSEIMLQQTRVETVKSYFMAFTKKFPTIFELAKASQDDVMELWAGLGYYSRARTLHKCAKMVVDEYQGKFPTKSEELIELPGIGPYTSAAIASISFGEVIVAIDGNLHRVLSRLYAHKKDREHSFSVGQKIIDTKRAGDFNQALMDLGSSICIAKSPKCHICPLSSHCKAFLSDTISQFPLKKKKKAVPKVVVLSGVFILHNEVLLCKRPNKGLFGGLLENPSFWLSEAEMTTGTLKEKETILKEKWKEEFHMEIQVKMYCGQILHKLTHRHLYTDVFVVEGNVPTQSSFYQKLSFQSPDTLTQISTFCEKTIALYQKIQNEGKQLSLF
jgi:A/G-specific adenine glycosylase